MTEGLPEWPDCAELDCRGARIGEYRHCLEHLPRQDRSDYLATLGPRSAIDLRGTRLSEADVADICAALRDDDGYVRFGVARFQYATFTAPTSFARMHFDDVWFRNARFEHDVSFLATRFLGGAWFGQARFGGQAMFAHATFSRTARFNNTTFDGLLLLNNTTFAAGVTMRLAGGTVEAHRTTFGAPSSIAGIVDAHVELRTLEETDCAQLSVAALDLTSCRLAGSHNLDQLRVEGNCDYPQPPSGLLHDNPRWPVWWWTRRRVLPEEGDWRVTTPKGRTWPTTQGSRPPNRQQPEQLAVLYRQRRTAHEAGGDQAGANDFYYGEMEMRRHAAGRQSAEHWLLGLYWLVSGYGLRAIRALTCLTVLVLLIAVGLHTAGYAGASEPVGSSAIYAIQSAISMEPADPPQLTTTGEALRVVIRAGGPLFLVLALLAIRNRVKR